MVVKELPAFDVSDMGKCHATKKVTRQVKVSGKKVRLSGRITCRKYLMAHVYHPDFPHSGRFNHNAVEWKLKTEEKERFLVLQKKMREVHAEQQKRNAEERKKAEAEEALNTEEPINE